MPRPRAAARLLRVGRHHQCTNSPEQHPGRGRLGPYRPCMHARPRWSPSGTRIPTVPTCMKLYIVPVPVPVTPVKARTVKAECWSVQAHVRVQRSLIKSTGEFTSEARWEQWRNARSQMASVDVEDDTVLFVCRRLNCENCAPVGGGGMAAAAAAAPAPPVSLACCSPGRDGHVLIPGNPGVSAPGASCASIRGDMS